MVFNALPDQHMSLINPNMDVVVSLGNMWLPATCIGRNDDEITVTIKYSKLAAELNVVSVTMSLRDPSRVELDPSSPDLFPGKPVEEKEERPKLTIECVHTTNLSASSVSSTSSDSLFCYDEEQEKFHSGEIDFDLFPEEVVDVPVLPEGTCYFHEILDTARACLSEILDVEAVEDIVFDFLGLDAKLFVKRMPNLGFSPFTPDSKWSILYRRYKVEDGIKVFTDLGGPALNDLFPTYRATFDVETHRVSIQAPGTSTVEPPSLPFSMVPTGEDYLIHIYKDVSDPIFDDLLVNWRAPSTK